MKSNSSTSPSNTEMAEVGTSGPRVSFFNSTPSLSVRARRALYENTLGARRGNIPHIPLGESSREVVSAGTGTGISPLKRRPLGFLSPNFLKQQGRSEFTKKLTAQPAETVTLRGGGGKTAGNINSDTHISSKSNNNNTKRNNNPRSVLHLQQDIADLQHRLDVIQYPEPPLSDDADNEALQFKFTLSPQDYQHVQELNQKLQQIQTGLLDIEGERCILLARAYQLEQEKEQLGQQLGLREREIETLQKRCAAAAEQSKTNAVMRETNKQLEYALKELQNKQNNSSDDHVVQLMELQVALQQNQAAKETLLQRLQNVQRDHDGVCASLQQCLTSVEKLTNETSQWEAERLRLCEEHESQLELQRIDHMQAIAQFRDELKTRETKVHDLDRLLQEKVMSIARLRNQLVALEASKAEAVKRMSQECEQKILRIEEEHDKTVENQVEQKLQHIVNQCVEQEISFAQDEITALQDKLVEKSAEIEALRSDVSVHMEKLMAATSELQKLQEDSAMLDGLFQDVETLECERHHLSEKLHDKDMEIVELSAEILKLEIEKELAGQSSSDSKLLNDKLEAAERDSDASLLRLYEVEAACQGLENEIRRLNEDNDETVARIRSECDEAISEMQRKLQLAEMSSQTEGIVHAEVSSDKGTAQENLALSQIARLESEVRRWHAQAMDLERQIVASALERTNEMESLKQNATNLLEENVNLQRSIQESGIQMEQSASKHRRSSVDADNKIDRLEDQVRQLQATIADIEHQKQAQLQEHQREIDSLSQQVCKARSVTASSEAQVEALLQEYQSTINKLTDSAADMKRERDFSRMSLESSQRKLDEESMLLAKTAQSYRELAATETGLRDECRQLRSERDALLLRKESEMVRLDSGVVESLRRDLAVAEQTLVSHEHQMATLEEALRDQTTQLANTVSRNKYLEIKQDRSESQFKVMEAHSSNLQVCLLDKEDEIRRLQAQWQKQEDSYLEEIHTERNLREIRESDLTAVVTRLGAIKLESRDLLELEKENNLLKDKIRRQEAYLQRKIEQEKAARERAIPGSAVKAPPSVVKQAAASRTSTSGIKGGPVRALASDHASRATRSTFPETESIMDIELETLLAD